MDFFCAKCQKRHSVNSISADMWSICKDDISFGLDEVAIQMQDNVDVSAGSEVADLFDGLNQFVNRADRVNVESPYFRGDTRINSFFALNAGNIGQLVEEITKNGTTMSGTYVVRLDTIISLFENYADNRTEKLIQIAHKYITPEWGNKSVCEKEIVVSFDDNLVLDKVTDRKNVAFEKDGKMLGFHRICAHCGRELSRASGRAEEIVVALAGSPRAGKSSCMVAMINTLLHDPTHGISIIPQSHDVKWAALEKEIKTYRKCVKITKTPDNSAVEVPAHSLLIQIKDAEKTERVLTIVDMPGEFWQSGDGLTAEFFEKYSGIYENIDCIWLLSSKATVRMSQSEIPRVVEEELLQNTSESAAVVNKANPRNLMVNLGMLKDHLLPRNKPMPATIVIVTKPDFCVSDIDREETVTYELFPEDSMAVAAYNSGEMSALLNADSQMLYGINEMQLCRHALNVRSFVESVNPAFLSAIEDNCEHRFFISLAPYGRPAYNEGHMSGSPTPYHELYPLLWTLAITGSLQIYHKCRWLTRNFLGFTNGYEDTEEAVVFDYRRGLVIPGRKQREKDYAHIVEDISNNMLMHSAKFVGTIFDHERE